MSSRFLHCFLHALTPLPLILFSDCYLTCPILHRFRIVHCTGRKAVAVSCFTVEAMATSSSSSSSPSSSWLHRLKQTIFQKSDRRPWMLQYRSHAAFISATVSIAVFTVRFSLVLFCFGGDAAPFLLVRTTNLFLHFISVNSKYSSRIRFPQSFYTSAWHFT